MDHDRLNPHIGNFRIEVPKPLEEVRVVLEETEGIAMDIPRGVMTPELVDQAREATLFGVPIYATFVDAAATPMPTATRVFTLILIALMTVTTFLTQRQLIVKNSAKDNPMVQQQKILLYVFPGVRGVGEAAGGQAGQEERRGRPACSPAARGCAAGSAPAAQEADPQQPAEEAAGPAGPAGQERHPGRPRYARA